MNSLDVLEMTEMVEWKLFMKLTTNLVFFLKKISKKIFLATNKEFYATFHTPSDREKELSNLSVDYGRKSIIEQWKKPTILF
jgi:hypothetical protein